MKGRSKMNCGKIKKLLIGYYENSLSIEEKGMVESHLRTCQACREELKEIGSLFEVLRGEKTEETQPDFWINFVPEIRKRIDRAPRPGWGWNLVPKLAPLFGFVTVILLVGVILFSRDYRFLNRAVPEFEQETIYTLYDFENTTDQLAEVLSLTESAEGMATLISAGDGQSISALQEIVEDQYWEKTEWDDLLDGLSLEELDLLEQKIEKITI
jgi:hypothetical protein